MNYRLLGKTGLRISELCLGTMTFGEEWGWGSNEEECRKIFDLFVERGGNFIDTANYYTGGTSEKMVGKFVKGDRDRYVIATKYTLSMNPSDPNASGNHRKNLMHSVKESLERLQTDYIDLMWVHVWDQYTPIEETMRGLNDLVQRGLVHAIGISDTPAWLVSKANTIAEKNNWTPFSALQVEHSLLERTTERELLPMAQHYQMTSTAWSPLAGGALTGKYLDAKPDDSRFAESKWGDRYLGDKNKEITRELVQIAKSLNRTPAQVALNWLLKGSPFSSIPIIGARKISQMKDNLECLDFQLETEQLNRLNELSQVSLGFPHDFLKMVQPMIHGEHHEKIQRH